MNGILPILNIVDILDVLQLDNNDQRQERLFNGPEKAALVKKEIYPAMLVLSDEFVIAIMAGKITTEQLLNIKPEKFSYICSNLGLEALIFGNVTIVQLNNMPLTSLQALYFQKEPFGDCYR